MHQDMRHLLLLFLVWGLSSCVHKSHDESNDALNNRYYSEYVFAYRDYDKVSIDSTLHSLQLYLEKFPNNSKAIAFLARVYLDKHDIPHAEAAYKRAIAVDARSSAALAALGTLYSWDGRYDSALLLIDRAIAIGDSNNYYFLNRAIINIKKNDLPAAQNAALHFIQLDTMDNQLIAHLAVVNKVLKNEQAMNKATAMLIQRKIIDTMLNSCMQDHITALEFFELKRKGITDGK